MMDVLAQIRRAISMPLLCRDDQILDGRRPSIRGPDTDHVYRPLSKVKRNSPRRANVKTWTRLMDNRPGAKVHPTIDEEEKIHIGANPPPQGGSSLDLSPALMTIYDSYSSTNRSYSSCEGSLNTSNVTSTPNFIKTNNGYFRRDVNKNVSKNEEGDSSDEDVVINMENSIASQQSDVSVRTPGSDSEASQCFASPTMSAEQGVASLTLELQNDAKKRPLSISSTSSSTSSTSSLPRHQRKKVATCMGPLSSPLVTASCGAVSLEEYPTPSHLPHSTMELHDVDEDASEEEEELSKTDSFSSPHNGSFVSARFRFDLSKSDADPDRSSEVSSVEPSPRTSRLSMDYSGLSYIDKVVTEIIETEKTYVTDLKDIIQGYLEYITSSQDMDMTQEDIDALFGNIQSICEFNSDFLCSLEKCEANPVQVAQCFVDNNEGFVIYSDYCTNYPRSVEVLTKCMRDHHLAEMFKQQQLSLKHGLPLGSYLLKPVQRILKYHLLLQNILNHYDKSSPGREVLTEALASMTSMAEHINEMKRKHEHTVRVQEIQSILYGWDGADLTTLGELVMEDTFRMCGVKAQRNIFLFEEGILIAKKKMDGNLLVKGFILCSNLMLIESIPKEPLNYHVIPFDNPRLQHTIQARSLEQKRKWCHQIKKLILENYNAVIPDKAKELVMNMLGRSREEEGLDDSNLENVDPGKKQHTAPEYLEKRRGRRRSTSLIPDFGLLKSKKNTKKGDTSSPRNSPRTRRKSDVIGFLPSARKRGKGAIPARITEDILNETQSEVVLRENTCNRGSRRKNRPLSRSLESLNLALALCEDGSSEEKETSDLESRVKSFDDSSSRARRISQILTEEGLRAQLNGDCSTIGWDKNMVSSVLENPSVKQAESDCLSKKQIYDHSESVQSSGASVTTCDNSDNNSMGKDQQFDDGYCNVMFHEKSTGKHEITKNPPYSNVVCQSSPATTGIQFIDEEEGDYIKIHYKSQTSGSGSEGTPDSDCVTPCRKSQIIANQHACNTDSIDNDSSSTSSGRSNGAYISETRLRLSCTAPDLQRTFSDHSTPKAMADVGVYDNWQVGLYDNVLFSDISQAERLDSCRLSGIGANGLKSNTSAINTCALTDNCRAGSPTSMQTSEDISNDDPWIPRACMNVKEAKDIQSNRSVIGKKPMPKPKPTSIGLARVNSYRQPEITCKVKQKKNPKLFRSNSFSSMDDLDECGKSMDGSVKGHRRIPSDTLVFANRSAFLATPSPVGSIKRELGVERALARLATPPRDMGPDDLIKVVKECHERGRIATRYATPPRTVMDQAQLSVLNDGAVIANSYSCEFGKEVNQVLGDLSPNSPSKLRSKDTESSPAGGEGDRPATIALDSSEVKGDLWSDVEDYLKQNEERATPPHKSLKDLAHRPGSFHGVTHHSVTSHGAHKYSSRTTSPATSPTSVHSNEGIVGSLRNVVMNITNKITGRSHSHRGVPSSAEGSPIRSCRTQSVSALEELQVDSATKILKSSKEKEKRKEKRHRFVYQLARAYSDRVKQRTKSVKKRDKSLADSEQLSTSTRELNNLLQESKQGGTNIGARMAEEACTSVVGTYTLPRHRYFKKDERKIQKKSKLSSMNCPQDSNQETQPVLNRLGTSQDWDNSNSAHDSGCMDDYSTDQEKSAAKPHSNIPSDVFTTLSIPTQNFNIGYGSLACQELDNVSLDYYYEKKFVEDLEGSLVGDTFRDSGLFCEEGASGGSGVTDAPGAKNSIKDTVKLIEQKTQVKQVQKVEVKRIEKAQGIQEILRTLEKSKSLDDKDKGDLSNDDLLLVKSIRDRTRELVECARLTRIRQDSCTVGDDHHREAPLAGEDSEKDAPAAKRGWCSYRR